MWSVMRCNFNKPAAMRSCAEREGETDGWREGEDLGSDSISHTLMAGCFFKS